MTLYSTLLDASIKAGSKENDADPDELCNVVEVESKKIIERIKETYGEENFARVMLILESLSYYQALCEGDLATVVASNQVDLTPFVQRIAIATLAVWEQGKGTTENSTV